MYRFIVKPKPVAFIIVALLGASVCSVVAYLYSVTNAFVSLYPSLQVVPITHTIDELQQMTGIQLPREATDIHNASFTAWQSRIIGVRLSIPSNTLDELLDELKFTGALQEGLNPFPDGSAVAISKWWTPEHATRFSGAKFGNDQTQYNILVDQTNSNLYIVYLEIEQD